MSHHVKIDTLVGNIMPKRLTKALRGKRRWIGCHCKGFSSRSELTAFLSDLPVKLFDFYDEKCILQVNLLDYEMVRDVLSSGRIVSITSSGKIKLVRERMEMENKSRKC